MHGRPVRHPQPLPVRAAGRAGDCAAHADARGAASFVPANARHAFRCTSSSHARLPPFPSPPPRSGATSGFASAVGACAWALHKSGSLLTPAVSFEWVVLAYCAASLLLHLAAPAAAPSAKKTK